MGGKRISSVTTMLFIGSVFAVIAGGCLYRSFRESLPVVLKRLLWNVRLILLTSKEVPLDWIHAKYNKNECEAQTGRIAIVTGGSRGLGFEVVKVLLELNMEVIIACRTPSAGEKAILQIRESGIKTGVAKVYKLDNASLESVKNFAAEIKRDYKKIHVLINNAGVMFGPYQETVDGFEQQWEVNYLSHFLLTSLLLPLLKVGGLPNRSSRIVNVSSCAHLLGSMNFNDTTSKTDFITEHAYSQSKLAQEAFTKRLQSLLKEKQYHVQVYSVHPGVILTDLFAHVFFWKCRRFMQYFFKRPREGAISITYPAVNKALENCGGTYTSNCRPRPVHPDVLNVFLQDKLFKLSLKQVQLNDFFQYVE